MKRIGSGTLQKQRPAPWLFSSLAGSAIILAAPAAWAGVITPSPSFTPINVIQGQKSVYTLTLGNDDTTAAAGLGFTVTLPAGVKLSGAPSLGNTCAGTLNAAANGTTFGITGGSVPGRVGSTDGKCEIKLEMVGAAGGNQVVAIPAGAITSTPGITNTQAGNATLQVTGLNAVTTQVLFNPSPLPQGLKSLFTLKFDNPNSIPLTGMSFTNIPLPAGLKIAPGTPTNVCGGNLLAVAGSLGFDLTNATLAPGGCEISFYWEADGPITGSAQDFNFTFPDGKITTDNSVSNTAGSGTLKIVKDLRVSQAFNRGDVYINEASELTVSFENAGIVDLTSSALTVTLPANLTIAPGTPTTSCAGGTVTPNGTGGFTLTGGTIPAATLTSLGKCDVKINVVSGTAATYTSTINVSDVTNAQLSGNINKSTADLLVQDVTGLGTGIGVGVRFTAPIVSANNVSRMSIDLYNGSGLDLTGITSGAGIQLPAGVVLSATPNPTTTCAGGAASAVAPNILKLDTASLTRRQGCTVEVDVISQVPAIYTENVAAGQFTSTQNRSSSAASGNLEVIDFINLEQSFNSNVVAASAGGNKTRMKLKLSNAAKLDSVATKLQFGLALGLKFAGGVVSNSCAGTLNLPAGGTAFDLSGATIPQKTGPAIGQDGFCEIEYDVIAAGVPGVINQNIPVNALTNGVGQSNRKPVDTPLTLADVRVVLNQQILNRTPGDPNSGKPIVKGGDPAELIVTLNNTSGIQLTNVGFPNTLGAGMIVYPDPTSSSTCAGTPVINAVPSAAQYDVSGITLAPGATCQVKLLITSLVKGNTDNVITAKAITSAEGGTNPDESRTTLTVEGNATLSKSFAPTSIVAGGKSRLTLAVINANNIQLTNAQVVDTLPTGMVVADVPNLQTNCVGTTSAPAGSTVVSLKGGTLKNNSICSLAVDVTSLTSGTYTNLLPAGTLTTAEAYTNDRDISAILTVTGTSIERPGLKLVKRITEINNPPATPGGTPEVIALNGVVNVTPVAGPDDDNAAGWPAPLGASGVSSYLRGAVDASTLAQQGNVKSGSTVEYTGYFLAEGTGDSKNVVMCDFVPAKTTYVPGSLQAQLGDGTAITAANATLITANFPAACKGTDSGNGAVVVTVPNLPKSTGPGAPATSYGSFKFRVKIN
jgi:uncharacterized repeat protein (TIGR01451 family)